MEYENLQAHIVVQTPFGENNMIVFVLATYDDDGLERTCVVMDFGDVQTVLWAFDVNVPFEVAASAFWAITQGVVVDASDRAYEVINGTPEPESQIIIPDTATVAGINKESH